ncbi:MAG: TIGR03435 family protein [Bryobacteraceae bacterium]|jgi:uncharacterized protein (TIGR03435 family)
MTIRTIASLIAFAACAAPGQTPPPPAFEVASVKLVEESRGALNTFSSSGPRVRYIAYSTVNLVMEAYNVKRYQVAFAPKVTALTGGAYGYACYDIEAKAEGALAPTRDGFRSMLQTLLADRFKLKLHRAAKEMPVYALTVATGGPKFKESAPDAVESANIGGSGRNPIFTASRKSMAVLARIINDAFFVDRPVVDQTELSGVYDFKIEATPDSRMNRDDPNLENISIFTAVQQQLGLKLEPRKAMIEVLVVDHIEQPSAN